MAQTPDEKTYVEIPFIEQLKAMGWEHIEGDIDVPYVAERESFHAKFFLEMVVKYGKEIDEPPEVLPSGWAAVLCLYDLRL